VLTGAYAFGPISGGHFNPAVTFGLFVGGRFPVKDVVPYFAAQVTGGVLAAVVLALIASGVDTFHMADGFATNGYGEHSPQHYSLFAGFLTEVVMTFMFLMVILGATSEAAPKGFAPIAIGLALTLIHLISIPVTNTSVNPARSTAVAAVQGGWAWDQLWMFWFAPLIGAGLAGCAQKRLERTQVN
jgi:aquaporin Z